MDRFVSILGVMIGIMLVLFFLVGKYMQPKVEPSFGSCGQIQDENSKNECLRTLASQNLDITPCLEIEKTSVRDICLRNVAIRSKESAICRQIVTPEIRQMCIGDLS